MAVSVLVSSSQCYGLVSCPNPEGGQGVQTPEKNHKNIVFSSNTGPAPLKNRQATNGVSLAGL